jgi:hypothetical protein
MLSIRVVNFWVNRMIGDLQPGAKPYTFAPIQPFKATIHCRRRAC